MFTWKTWLAVYVSTVTVYNMSYMPFGGWLALIPALLYMSLAALMYRHGDHLQWKTTILLIPVILSLLIFIPTLLMSLVSSSGKNPYFRTPSDFLLLLPLMFVVPFSFM